MNKNTKPTKEWFYTAKGYSEIALAVQEWGIKNEMRLFGITNIDFEDPRDCDKRVFVTDAYFTDTGFKSMMIISFELKNKSGKVTVLRSKWWDRIKGTKWPIKLARTKEFKTDSIDTVIPLYEVLIDRGIILPFKSTLKAKEWEALPFENMSGIKSTEI